MSSYKKSPMDELFHDLMGYYPAKEGAAYEIISTAVLGLIKDAKAVHNQFMMGSSHSRYQLDGLIDGQIMLEAKDYTKKMSKVGRDDLQKLQGALTDLPQIITGYFASATDYTKPALQYAKGTSVNLCQKEIVPIELRKSAPEDEKGRIKQINVQLETIYPDFGKAVYEIIFFDESERQHLEDFCKGAGLAKINARIKYFYNSEGEVIDTVENICRTQPMNYSFDSKEAEGIFEISAYVCICERLFAIKGIKYRIPINVFQHTLTIKKQGNASILVKSESLGINKLITDVELENKVREVLQG